MEFRKKNLLGEKKNFFWKKRKIIFDFFCVYTVFKLKWSSKRINNSFFLVYIYEESGVIFPKWECQDTDETWYTKRVQRNMMWNLYGHSQLPKPDNHWSLFIKFYLGKNNPPVFNCSDLSVCIYCVYIFLHLLRKITIFPNIIIQITIL